jgi:mannose-1-phosphate guanylyltransferase
LTISKEVDLLGTAGPLKLIEKELTEPFLVMNGDILSNLDVKHFYNFAFLKESMLTMAIK